MKTRRAGSRFFLVCAAQGDGGSGTAGGLRVSVQKLMRQAALTQVPLTISFLMCALKYAAARIYASRIS